EIAKLQQQSYYSVNAGGECMSSQLSLNTAQGLEALETSGPRGEPFIQCFKSFSSPSGSLWPSCSSPGPRLPGGPRVSIPSRLVSRLLSTIQAGELAITLRNPHRSQGRILMNQREVLRGGEPCHDSAR